MKNKEILETIWAGSEASLDQYLKLEAQAVDMKAAGYIQQAGGDDSQDDEDVPYLLDISEDGVGTISIVGPTTNKEAWYNSLLNVASYGAIRAALVYAAESSRVNQIVLNINSGGGAVNGVADTAKLISLVNSKVKPVTAYTDGAMSSAAYWLGSSAGKIYASNISSVGSIGVIATHMEYSKQLEQDGIKATVLRSGKFKALANSFEPLSEDAKKSIQAGMDVVYKVFVQHVAEVRNQPYDFVDQNMAQGREFVGEQALAAGLVDGITSFDELMSQIEAKSLDKSKQVLQTNQNFQFGATNMTKKALTEASIAALAAGGTVEVESSNEVVKPTAEEIAAAVALLASVEQTEVVVEASEVTKLPKENTEVISFLQTQIKEKDESLVAAGVKTLQLEAKIADQSTHFDALLKIAAASTNNMRIALGGTAVDMTGKSGAEVLADHAKIATDFQTKFKAGGVAAVDASAEVEDVAATAGTHSNALWQAQLDSVGGKQAKKGE